MRATGFAYFRDGKLHGFDSTKRGLLIGYDMMPLIGLRRMERRLLAKGTIERVRIVVDHNSNEWGATLEGEPVLAFASWQGGLSFRRKHAERSLAGFVASELRQDGSEVEQCLYQLWCPPRDKRHVKPTAIAKAKSIVADLGYSVEKMRFVTVN